MSNYMKSYYGLSFHTMQKDNVETLSNIGEFVVSIVSNPSVLLIGSYLVADGFNARCHNGEVLVKDLEKFCETFAIDYGEMYACLKGANASLNKHCTFVCKGLMKDELYVIVVRELESVSIDIKASLLHSSLREGDEDYIIINGKSLALHCKELGLEIKYENE